MRTIKFISCTDYLELVKNNMFGKLGTLMSKVKVTTVTDRLNLGENVCFHVVSLEKYGQPLLKMYLEMP